jgi:DNA gyrase subunit A
MPRVGAADPFDSQGRGAPTFEGLKIAVETSTAIASSGVPGSATAREGLMAQLGLSVQAQAVLDMRLQRLTGLEREKIVEEYNETVKIIEGLRRILADDREVSRIITEELRALKEKYADPRRTQLVDEAAAISVEDLIVEEDMVVTISHEGYVKRNPVGLYRAQRRGGRGKIGATTRDEDFVEYLFAAITTPTSMLPRQGRCTGSRSRDPQAGGGVRRP